MATVVVTRHPALVELLVELRLIEPGTPVLDHASPDDVRGKHVIGVLPLSLAALAASVTEIPLALDAADRGIELTIERLRQIAGDPVTYRVEDIRKPRVYHLGKTQRTEKKGDVSFDVCDGVHIDEEGWGIVHPGYFSFPIISSELAGHDICLYCGTDNGLNGVLRVGYDCWSCGGN